MVEGRSFVAIYREKGLVPRKLVRPMSGEATSPLSREDFRELGDQGRPAIK